MSAPAVDAARRTTSPTTDLGSLGGPSGISVAYDINKHGQIVGLTDTADGVRHAFLYENGVMTDLGTLGGHYSVAMAINDHGQVVGVADLPNGDSHAFLWERGVMTDLGTLGGTFSQANDINNRGHIVGQAELADGRTHAFIWKNGTMTDLGTLPGDDADAPNSVAEAINDKDQIVGWGDAWNADFGAFLETHAILWKSGRLIDLDPGQDYSRAYDINKHGQIVGEALLFDGALGHSSFYAVRWDRQRVIQRGPERAVPRAINDKGQIVGQTDESKPFLWSDGNMTELAALDGLYGAANAISNHGRIVGETEMGAIPVRATLWKP